MLVLFEFGSLLFWVFFVVASIITIAILEKSDYPGAWSTIWVAASFVTLYYLGAKTSITELLFHILHNPIQTVVLFLLYTTVGILWSFVEWRWFVQRKARFLREQSRTIYIDIEMPKASENKNRIFGWTFYWPWSVAWFLMHRPLEKLYEEIQKLTAKIYAGIAEREFADLKNREEHRNSLRKGRESSEAI